MEVNGHKIEAGANLFDADLSAANLLNANLTGANATNASDSAPQAHRA